MDRPAAGETGPPRDQRRGDGPASGEISPHRARLGTDNPRAGILSPARDGRARLGTDRPASGEISPVRERHVVLVEGGKPFQLQVPESGEERSAEDKRPTSVSPARLREAFRSAPSLSLLLSSAMGV